MTAVERRAKVKAAYKLILGRNIYDQNATRRECVFVKYKDGKYYSDCSSSIRKAYEYADIGVTGIGSNTVAQYRSTKGKKVPVPIKNGIPTDISMLRIGDCLYFAGNDESRAYADYVGHVEMVYNISGNTVTLAGHGSGKPSTKGMKSYCQTRQKTKADTKRGNRGLLCVKRWVSDDPAETVAPADPMKPAEATGLKVTGDKVNIRTGPGTNFASVGTVNKGAMLAPVVTGGWQPVLIGGEVRWISAQYTEAVNEK